MQTHTDTRSPLTRESTARIIRSDAPAKPNARLPQATMPRAADRPAKYRHEYKYEISLFDFFSLTRTLRTIMQPDPHADQDGQYLITSLYFDNCFDKALREKRDGLNQREKFRLRYYGSAPEKVFLEKKQKHAGLCLKSAAPLTLAECKLLLAGQRDWMLAQNERPLLAELAFKARTQLLRLCLRRPSRFARQAYRGSSTAVFHPRATNSPKTAAICLMPPASTSPSWAL